jgi:hypothetical protein
VCWFCNRRKSRARTVSEETSSSEDDDEPVPAARGAREMSAEPSRRSTSVKSPFVRQNSGKLGLTRNLFKTARRARKPSMAAQRGRATEKVIDEALDGVSEEEEEEEAEEEEQ